MSKVIGISKRDFINCDINMKKAYNNLLDIISKNGFTPYILTNNNLEENLSKCKGFIIPGGIDISPKFYHEKNSGLSINCDDTIDYLDKTIIDYSVNNKKPLLGICRGLQAINVFMGGSLYQDINNHKGISHKLIGYENELIDLNNTIVNSFHHQAIKRLADNFIIIAKTNDNIIEAILHKYLPIIAFQWHPEVDLENMINEKIFKTFFYLINKN